MGTHPLATSLATLVLALHGMHYLEWLLVGLLFVELAGYSAARLSRAGATNVSRNDDGSTRAANTTARTDPEF